MANVTVELRVVIVNRKALRALRKVAEVLDDVGEDMPWRDDVVEAKKAMAYAVKHLDLVED